MLNVIYGVTNKSFTLSVVMLNVVNRNVKCHYAEYRSAARTFKVVAM